MSRPLIGIEVDLETNAKGRRYTKCYETYFDRVVDAGGAPVLLPPVPEGVARQLVGQVEGVVVPGGDDFHASAWGDEQRPCERYNASDERRLVAGRRLVELVLEAGRPYLGVCYGAQLLNLLRGGSLVQDIPDEVEGCLPHAGPPHSVDVTEGTLLRRLVGDGPWTVNSRHHQAIGRVGAGLVVTATAPDGVIEAVEDPSQPFLVGVQWHPEELVDQGVGSGLFEGLVQAALAARRVTVA